ncbi:RagB/SusD family nutrient uptake outer membrane protein [Aegicerativicinus sediminis]|uniref:RagB/SusD family nutrient uptake outer membrane protein n=1 Tax=Aegicerativicinus sediminis TaxID=2893202 RepID=UPI001E5D3746|nr:RagB/SusD family nutrient uptake outer membrane protein [Aegicerativicinus sediminis]
MKRKINIYTNFILLITFLFIAGCTDDLDQSDPNSETLLSAEEVYSNPDSYIQLVAKLYAGLATTGQSGPAGNPDITGIDEGESQYIRGYWVMQELTTDEAVISWNDKTIKDFHYHTWTAGDAFINATFNRLDFQVKNCNEFLRQTTDEKLDSRGISGSVREEIATYRAEARFLRALSYWHFLDLYGSVGLVKEDSPTDFFLPEQASSEELFTYVKEELLDLVNALPAMGQNDYPRADQGAANMLLAKLYMNAEAYIGEKRFAEALPYIQNILNGPYSLHDSYEELFLADNDSNGAQNEFIFAVAYDGLFTQTYGGTTFLTHAPVGGEMNPDDFGIDGGWAGLRTTSALVNKFQMGDDQREQFFTQGQNLEIEDIGSFTDGYAIAKWKNIDSQGEWGSNGTGAFADTDFPMFRLADAYLMYAEIVAREEGGSESAALGYVNALRERAFGDSAHNISTNDLTEDFILDERARELHWEAHRRTDLIRFKKFTGSAYLWPWKGRVPNGAPTESYRNIFPIPSNSLAANPNLTQNPGY